MPIIIASKTRYAGTITPSALNVETTVIEVPGLSDDYLIEGYLDLSSLSSGDTLVLREYISVDGVNYRLFNPPVTYTGPVSEPIIRFHTKTLLYNMRYRVTITQTSGALRSIPYAFLVELMGQV